MNNEKNISTLLDIIAEQRESISTLKESLDKAKSDSSMFRRWWIESTEKEEKSSEGSTETVNTIKS